MSRIWPSLAHLLTRRVAATLLVCLAVTVALATGLSRLDFATGQDSYLNKDSEVAKDNVVYQTAFGGPAMLVLFTGDDVVDLFSSDNLSELKALEEDLRASGVVESVIGPYTALEFTAAQVEGGISSVAAQILLRALQAEPDPAAQQARQADLLLTNERLTAAGEPSLDNPAYVEFLIFDNKGNVREPLKPFFPDSSHGQMVVRLPGNASIEDEGTASDTVVDLVGDHDFEGFDVLATGSPVLLKGINDYLQGGMATLGAIAAGIMVLVLLLVFRVRSRLLPLAVVAVGAIWAFGLLGHLGIPLSLVTISGLPIIVGMGADFAILVHSRAEEEISVEHVVSPFTRAISGLGPPLLVAIIAAVLAALALELSRVPMIRDFGIMLAVGLAVLWVAGIVLTTSVLAWRERRKPSVGTEETMAGRTLLERSVVRLGSLPQRLMPVLIVASLILLVAGIAVEDRFEIQTDPERWVSQDTQAVKDLNTLRDEVGSSSELGYLVEAPDVTANEVLKFVDEFSRQELNEEKQLLTVSSLPELVSGLSGAAPTVEDVEAVLSVAPPDVRKSLISEDGQRLNVLFIIGPGSLENRAELVDRMQADLRDVPPDVRLTASGLAIIGVGLLHNLKANRALLTWVALGLVALWLLVRYRSISRTLLPLVPVLIAVGGTTLFVALSGIELSPITTVSGPLVIANCTEFSVLIMARYVEERRRGRTPEEAHEVASARTGRAFAASALTAVGGFGVLAFSSLPLLRDFGIIVALNVAIALLSALVVLPPLLVWADTRRLLRTD